MPQIEWAIGVYCIILDTFYKTKRYGDYKKGTDRSLRVIWSWKLNKQQQDYLSFFFGLNWLEWPHFLFLQLVALGGNLA